MATWKWDPRGTDEADVATPAPADSSGPTNLTMVKGTGGTIKYDTAFPLFGASNARITPGSAAATEPTWASMGNQPAGFARFYMRISAAPASAQRMCQGYCGGSQSLMGFDLGTDRKIVTKYSSSALTFGTLPTAIPIGQWIRVELTVNGASGSVPMKWETFHSPHSTVPTDTVSGTGSITNFNAFRLPIRYQWNGAPQVWIDGVELSDTAMPAPLPDPAGVPSRGGFFPFMAA